MTDGLLYKPELLAPAGSLDVFVTAVEEGADAVYIGAPSLNARALAKNFTFEELASMIDFGHKNRVKVYLAMNSLVREEEIPQLIELLSLLEQLAPDALIIQDLGLYWLVKKYFPGFTLHASTLMGAHNSLAVRQFADMGFKRVVLAREVTLAETRQIHEQVPVELEMFVHGALCFSYSGLCLFSSYLGGKSGLRGRCVQPCRRRYSWLNDDKSQQAGYFFSMNDLEAIELLPQLADAGVVSFKIEGRMRSASYVGSVVKAYRMIIDAGENVADVLPQAHSLLYDAMGRRPTSGYFSSSQPVDVITPFQTGNIGHCLGQVAAARKEWVSVLLQEPLEVGDRVRLHQQKSGERTSFTVKEIRDGHTKLDRGEKGMSIRLNISGAQAEIGDLLYKVDVKSRRRMESRKSKLTPPGQYKKMVEKAMKHGKALAVLKSLGQKAPTVQSKTGLRDGKISSPRMKPLPLWVKGSDLRVLNQSVVEKPQCFLVTLDRESFQQIQHRKKFHQNIMKTVIWVIPPVIVEDDVVFYRQAVIALLRKGFRKWMIGHIGQLQLFVTELEKSVPRGKNSSAARPELSSDYTLNVLNSLALKALAEQGIHTALLAPEADRSAIKKLCAHKKRSQAGVVVFGRIPLFTARLKPDFFQFNKIFTSPRGERFELVRRWGQTLALADKPFSLASQLIEIQSAGIDFALVDFSFLSLNKKDSAALRKSIFGKGGERFETFNYFRKLQ